MTGREHARLLGLFFWLLTGFQLFLVGVIGVIYIFIFGAVFSSMPHKAGDPPPEMFIPVIILVVGIIFVMTLLFAVPKIIAGYGLRGEKSWAKVWAIVACVVACMNVPFGTAVGVYGLIFILGDNGKAYFDDPGYGRHQGFGPGVQAPAPSSWQQQ